MREEFKEIISGWTLVCNPETIAERLEELIPLAPYNDKEQKYIEFMIQTQIAQGIERGDFDL